MTYERKKSKKKKNDLRNTLQERWKTRIQHRPTDQQTMKLTAIARYLQLYKL